MVMVNNKKYLVKSQLNKISEMIESAIEGSQLLVTSEICEEVGVSSGALHKYLKELDMSIYERWKSLMKRNIGQYGRVHTDKAIDHVCELSKEGKGIDTIEVMTGIDKALVVGFLRKRLGDEEYSRRHPKRRKGGHFGRTYTLPNGETVQSLKEIKVAELFDDAGISYTTQKEVPYEKEGSKRKCTKYVDFYLPDFDLYIEYAGMMSFNFYREQVRIKDVIYKNLGMRFLFISSLKEVRSLISFLSKHKNKEDIDNKTNQLELPLSHDGCFHTTQGEGSNTGSPCVFIRLSYCNLHCSWCDSKYTWSPDYINNKEKPESIGVAALFNKMISALKGVDPYRIIITGGEPLLFQDKLEYFIYYASTRGYSIDIETNGTIKPSYYMISFCKFNVSPKLSNNLNDKKIVRIVPEAIRAFKNSKNASFKFVISSEEDYPEVVTDFIEQFNIPISKVWLMPEGQTNEELSRSRVGIMNLCIEKGHNYSDRLQILVFNDKRRV